MKYLRPVSSFLASLVFLTTVASLPLAAATTTEPDPGQISISVGKLMEEAHYSRHKLDGQIAHRLLQTYLETLDYSKLFFTQEDVNAFSRKYGNTLDEDILLGNPGPAVEIFEIYKKRVEARVAKVKQWMATEKFDFKSNRSIVLNRQKAPWPKDDAEADQLWHDRLEGELLQEKLGQRNDPQLLGKAGKSAADTDAEHAKESPVKILTRRYDQILRNLNDETHEDATDIFFTCLAQTYDPHSEYMSKNEADNFKISMALSLVGIGAVLQSDDGYAKIMELVVGGPAQKEGHLKVGDRVTAVAQGSGSFNDVVGMKLDKVVTQIRGKKNTKVRLEVIPAHADPGIRKVIEIVRDEVKLKDKAASANLIERTNAHGEPLRLGWITLPSFYADMEKAGVPGATSTTEDVLALLNRLKKENISGLVIDLRQNGGGSLDEAIKLTTLFIKGSDPSVVQVKDANGKIVPLRAGEERSLKAANGETIPLRDKETGVAYDGPLIILTNTLSASASEIFAGALQDYGRALIVGDHHTFGKGTVQTMVDLSHFIPFVDGDAGELKLTIQKFYRVAGGSTQLHGVASDIVLPSVWDRDDIGESALKNPMPYDEVAPAPDFKKDTDHPLFADQLRQQSAVRVAANPEFKIVEEDLTRLKEKVEENRISLNEKTRREEIAKEKALRAKRLAERAKRKTPDSKVYTLTLDNVDSPELQLQKSDVAVSGTTLDSNVGKGKKSTAAHKDKKAEPAAEDKDVTDPGTDEEDDEETLASDKIPKIDPVRSETLNILSDLIDLARSGNTATVAK